MKDSSLQITTLVGQIIFRASNEELPLLSEKLYQITM